MRGWEATSSLSLFDPSLSGEYRLALNAEEKDALLYVPGGVSRPWNRWVSPPKPIGPSSPGAPAPPLGEFKISPSLATRGTFRFSAPTPVKYRDLKGLVEIEVSFDDLPFSHRIDYFNLNKERALVPLSVEIDNRGTHF